MMPGMNQKQMQSMMKRMGIAQQEVEATQVIIKTPTSILYFDNPQVSKVNAMGQQTYQLVGTPREEALSVAADISDEDVQTVASQAEVSADVAKKAIEDANGDLAEAIMNLQKE
ncbi:MAG: nascent polypeptide-associated complex subunit alpha [Candidatus Woesearchaeota archaeon]|jgi:nascent polypeptide-associated complex subunit alpha